jgi:hypothetical protein
METQSKMQNPAEQYEKPPYEEHSQQPVPGTEAEMVQYFAACLRLTISIHIATSQATQRKFICVSMK